MRKFILLAILPLALGGCPKPPTQAELAAIREHNVRAWIIQCRDVGIHTQPALGQCILEKERRYEDKRERDSAASEAAIRESMRDLGNQFDYLRAY